jgi:hypothetical protein
MTNPTNTQETETNSYAVTGNTYPARDLLRKAGFEFDKSSKSWIGNQSAKDELDKLSSPSYGRATARLVNALTVEAI